MNICLCLFQTYTQYIPLSIYDLQTWMGSPSIYVYDCSNAGIIVDLFKQFSAQREQEAEVCIYMSLRMRKTTICICENKDADQLCSNCTVSCAVTAQLISSFVFATRMVQFLFYLYPKSQASSCLLWLYSLVCVGPGRNPTHRLIMKLELLIMLK